MQKLYQMDENSFQKLMISADFCRFFFFFVNVIKEIIKILS